MSRESVCVEGGGGGFFFVDIRLTLLISELMIGSIDVVSVWKCGLVSLSCQLGIHPQQLCEFAVTLFFVQRFRDAREGHGGLFAVSWIVCLVRKKSHYHLSSFALRSG